MEIICGIDPGLSGGMVIAKADSDGVYVDVAIDLPHRRGNAKELDVKDISTRLKDWNVKTCVVEKVYGTENGSGYISGTSMYNYGRLLATLELYGCHVKIVPAKEWQSIIIPTAKPTQTKEASIAFCEQHWPQTGKADGITDALCLIYYYQALYI
jgi:hypothetical protein